MNTPFVNLVDVLVVALETLWYSIYNHSILL
jgi:hypothetical protein